MRDKIIRDFATRAFRRPITAEEESALMAVFEKSIRAGARFQDSVKDALLVVLTSPQFLFLIENSSTPAPEPLDDYELASKLSYFLWNGPPDRKTLKLAASRLAARTAGCRGRADDRRSAIRAVRRRVRLAMAGLDKFQVLEPDRKRFPKLTRDTRAQLRQEPVQFVQYLIRNNLPVRNLIESDFVVANEVVAGYYDLGRHAPRAASSSWRSRTAARTRRRARPGGDPGGAVGRARIEPGEARRLAGAQDHRRAAGRSAAERARAQGGDARTSRSASGSSGTATSPAAPSATRRSTRGECRFEEFDAGGRLKQAAGRCPFDVARQDRGRGRHRFEAIPRRRPHRPGRLQRAQASGDLRDRPQPDLQRTGVI